MDTVDKIGTVPPNLGRLTFMLLIARVPRVARLLNQKIQKFYMCSCMQYYYCIKEVRGNAGLIGATGYFYVFMSFNPPLCTFIAYFTIGITVT